MNTIYEEEFDTLVLSGSSSRGIAVLGALQYCYDNNLLNNVQYYIGTSSGFIINYLLIIGYTPIEILISVFTTNILEKMQKINFNNLLKGDGAVSWDENIGNLLSKMTLDKLDFIPTFEQLYNTFNKKLTGITFNASLENIEYLNIENTPDLSCIEAAKMSSNLPFLFEKCKYKNYYYIDGGIVNNFPIDIAKKISNKILGIITFNEATKDVEKNNKIIESSNQFNYIYKLIFVAIDHITETRIKNEDDNNIKIVKIPTGTLKSYNFNIDSKMKFSLFSTGYHSFN